MLKQRVLTSLVLVPLVLAAIFALPSKWFAVLVGVVILLAALEWSRMMQHAPRLWQYLAVVAMFAGIVALYALYAWSPGPVGSGVVIAGAAWWLIVTAWVFYYPAGLPSGRVLPLRKLLAGWLLLVPAWAAVSVLHARGDTGPSLVLLLFVIVWVADIAAYFAGHAWGRHRLAPHISPGKTVEGAAGGVLASVLVGLAGGALLGASGAALAALAVLVLIVALVSIVGDLAVSMFKRHSQIKDSGGLLPGHGGLLDRIDSLMAAAPVFVFGLDLLGLFA